MALASKTIAASFFVCRETGHTHDKNTNIRQEQEQYQWPHEEPPPSLNFVFLSKVYSAANSRESQVYPDTSPLGVWYVLTLSLIALASKTTAASLFVIQGCVFVDLLFEVNPSNQHQHFVCYSRFCRWQTRSSSRSLGVRLAVKPLGLNPASLFVLLIQGLFVGQWLPLLCLCVIRGFVGSQRPPLPCLFVIQGFVGGKLARAVGVRARGAQQRHGRGTA